MLLVLAVASFVLHLPGAALLESPGHADPSYYYLLAEGLAAGDGFQVPFTWHFLDYPDTIENRPNDYWMPLPSILMALCMKLFGNSLLSALLVPLVAASAVPLAAYALAMRVLDEPRLAMAVALMVLALPGLSVYALVPDGTALLAFVATATLAMTVAARKGASWSLFLAAGVGGAVAMLLRQDGALLTVSIGIAALSLRPLSTALRCATAAGMAFVVVAAPAAAMNVAAFGSPLPAAPRRTPWLTTYEELYSFGSTLTPERYLSRGMSALLEDRLTGALDAIRLFGGAFGAWTFAVAFVVLAAYGVLRARSRIDLIVILSFPVALLAVQIAVFPVIIPGGGIAKSAAAGVVSVFIAAAEGYRAMSNRGARRLIAGGAAAVFAALLVMSILAPALMVQRANAQGRTIEASMRGLSIPGDSAVMTRNPWEFAAVTGIEAVMIPFEGPQDVHLIACHFDVALILDDPTRDTSALVDRGVARRLRPGVLEVVGCPRGSA